MASLLPEHALGLRGGVEAKILAARWSSHVRSPENTAVSIMTVRTIMMRYDPMVGPDPVRGEIALSANRSYGNVGSFRRPLAASNAHRLAR